VPRRQDEIHLVGYTMSEKEAREYCDKYSDFEIGYYYEKIGPLSEVK
jgi:hypothetical protein